MSEFRFCLEASALHDEDSSALTDAIERYVGAGMPMARAQLAAIADVIADVRGEREQIRTAVREQHPQAVKPPVQVQAPAPEPVAANPFRTFLMRQGVALSLAPDFVPGTKERLAMGRTFRGNGLQLDDLAQRAWEQGYLHSPHDVDSLYDLITRAAGGERIAPLYGADGEHELAALVGRRRQLDADSQRFDLLPDELADTDFVQADPAVQDRVRAIIDQANAAGVDHESVLEDAARMAQNGTDHDFLQAAQNALDAAIARAGAAGARDRSANPGQAGAEAARRDEGQAGAAGASPHNVGGEPRQGVREPDAPYQTDLFGNSMPQEQRLPFTGLRPVGARPQSGVVRGNVQPTAGVRHGDAAEGLPGHYWVDTLVSTTAQRVLGTNRIRTPADLAQATRYLYRSPVERFDAIVTDDGGRPLAVVGGFKGATSQTSVYPGTLVSEALRVPGAAHIWFSHNHPSGTPTLSAADIRLNTLLHDVFKGSGVKPMGLIAVAGDKFQYHSPEEHQGEVGYTQPIPAGDRATQVPVYERELRDERVEPVAIGSPRDAMRVASELYAKAHEDGLVLLDAQNRVAAWVPLGDTASGRLRDTGGLATLYRAISRSNATSAILVHGGDLDRSPSPAVPHGPVLNIGKALQNADVRLLDSVSVREPSMPVSRAEKGLPLIGDTVFSRRNEPVSVEAKRNQIEPVVSRLTGDWLRKPDIHVLDSMNEAPEPVRRIWAQQNSQGAWGDIEGFHWKGGVYLVGDALHSEADVQRVLFHEALGHFGLRGVFGTSLDRVLTQVAGAMPREVAAKAQQYGFDLANPRHRQMAAEEVLAELAQTRPELGVVRSAVATIRTWLRAHGIESLRITREEVIRNFILPARGFVENGKRPEPSFLRSDVSFSRASTADSVPDEERTAKLADRVGAGYHAYAGVERVPRESSGSIGDSIAKALVPAGRKDAAVTAGIIRANLGEQAREREVAQQRLMEFAKRFDKMPVADNYKFIDAMERGIPLKDPEQARAAAALRKVLDERRDQVIALGKGNLENFNENYFPHIWKDKASASNFFTRRPLEGGKGFLKQRTYDYFSDGLKAGLEPVTTNPVELAMLKAREMDRYIYGQRIFQEMKDAGVAKFVAFGAKAPDGWVKINDKIARVMQYSEAEKGMILRGEYYAPEQAATLINNHLSPGLSGVAAFDMVRKAGNMMNAVQLGLSAFHLGFTTLDAMISKAALGIKQASRGNVVKGAGNVLQALNPAQPLMNLYKGDRLLKAYLGNVNDPDMAPIVEALTQAGGRVKMDDVYRNAAANEFRQAVRKGNYGAAALKVLPRVLDLINKPIFEYLVPRQKLGVFFDMAKDALEREPGMDLARKREVMGKLWDSVDNRMGELVYDNVFWNRALKDALQVSVRSVGWNLGTFREIGGGVKDVKDIRKLGGLSDRTAYIFGLTFIAAMGGMLTQYLYTGEGPREWKDLFFPRTGQTRPDGTEDRLSLPSYMKDIYEYGHDLRNFAKYGDDPFHTLENKLHPLVSTMSQIFTNKDFFGGAIRSPGDTPTQQALDEANYLLKQMSPFSLRNYQQQAKLKGEEPSIAGYLSSPSMIGITPAPGYITKTDAQAESSQVNKMRESLVTKFREEMHGGADWGEIRQRAMDAGIRGQDLEYIRRSAVQRPPKRMKEFASH